MAYENEEKIAQYRDLLAKGEKRAASRILDSLVRENDGLVYKVARRELRGASSENLEEAAQEGRIGLLRAIQDFDPSKESKFSSYACLWIRHHVQTAAHKQQDFARHRGAKMPGSVARACAKFRALHGREPEPEDVNCTREQWDAWALRTYVHSLQEPLFSPGGAALEDVGETYETVTVDPRETVTDAVHEVQLTGHIEAALAAMSPRNRDLIRAIFLEGVSEEATAERFGISRVRVRQLRPILQGRLRTMLDAMAAERARVKRESSPPPSSSRAA